MIWEDIVNQAKILIVDDEQVNVRLLQRMLEQAGYRNVIGTTDPLSVASMYREIEPDLIILDLMMPAMDGFGVMEALQSLVGPRSYVPILVLTADTKNESRLRALLTGAKDFLNKPVDRMEAMLRVRILLETRFLFRELSAGTPGGWGVD